VNYNIDKLKAVKNYAKQMGVSTAYIYKLISAEKIIAVKIDGVIFIDAFKYSKLPTGK
jgi:hypothetical protein